MDEIRLTLTLAYTFLNFIYNNKYENFCPLGWPHPIYISQNCEMIYQN